MKLRLSVIIVNYNGAHLIQDCIDGLEAQTRQADEVIVVDNGSSDGSLELLASRYPWLRLIDAGRNLGFSGANNRGIRASTGNVCILLNNDTIPSPGFIESLIEPLERSKEIAATAGVMLFSTSPESVATAGIEVFSDGLALDADIGADWRTFPALQPVFGPSGGAAAIRRSVLEDVELFPEPYFLYLEDVDLAWRMRMREHATVAVRDAWVLHHYSASSGEGSPIKDYHLARNRAWTLLRCWPSDLWKSHWHRVLFYELGAVAYGIANRKWGSLRGRIDGWGSFWRLRRPRNRIQKRVTAPLGDLLYWMRSAQSVRGQLRIRRLIQDRIDPRRNWRADQP